MKIAMMTNNYRPYIGGVPISIERLARSLRELGHRVVIFAPRYRQTEVKNQEEQEQSPEEDVVRYGTWSQHFYSDTVLPNPLDPVLEKTFAGESFDLIHVHHPVLIGRAAVHLSDKYGIPLVYTYHTQYEQYLDYAGLIHWLSQGTGKKNIVGRLRSRGSCVIKQRLAPWYLGGFMRHCHTVITPTEGMRQSFWRQYGGEYGCRAQLAVLPTGLPQESYRADRAAVWEIRQRYGKGEIPLLVTVCRLGPEKNVPFLLRVMARLKQQLPDFRLLVIGDGPRRQEYGELCVQLGIRQEICFLGSLPNREIVSYMAAADLFVFASKTETQGIVILEAMAAKTPVVALRAPGVEDLVEENISGYLCPEEEGAFAEQLLRVLQNESLRDRLRIGAFHAALGYREEAVAEKAVRIYTDTCRRYAMEQTAVYGEASPEVRERLRLPG